MSGCAADVRAESSFKGRNGCGSGESCCTFFKFAEHRVRDVAALYACVVHSVALLEVIFWHVSISLDMDAFLANHCSAMQYRPMKLGFLETNELEFRAMKIVLVLGGFAIEIALFSLQFNSVLVFVRLVNSNMRLFTTICTFV